MIINWLTGLITSFSLALSHIKLPLIDCILFFFHFTTFCNLPILSIQYRCTYILFLIIRSSFIYIWVKTKYNCIYLTSFRYLMMSWAHLSASAKNRFALECHFATEYSVAKWFLLYRLHNANMFCHLDIYTLSSSLLYGFCLISFI